MDQLPKSKKQTNRKTTNRKRQLNKIRANHQNQPINENNKSGRVRGNMKLCNKQCRNNKEAPKNMWNQKCRRIKEEKNHIGVRWVFSLQLQRPQLRIVLITFHHKRTTCNTVWRRLCKSHTKFYFPACSFSYIHELPFGGLSTRRRSEQKKNRRIIET